jgi:hypothetical protein
MAVFIIYFILGAVTSYVAVRKGYNIFLGILLAVLGIIGLVVAVVLPRRPPRQIGW